LHRGRQIAVVAAVIGLISSFFHWYTVSASAGSFSVSGSINAWHGWGLLAILGFVVAGAVALLPLGAQTLRALIPSLPPSVTEARVVLGTGVLAVVATIIFMATEGPSVSGAGLSAGPSFGAYVGLLCGIAIAVGGFLMQQEPTAA
jgi:hypothetical protein